MSVGFTVVCEGCGAEARNLGLADLFTAPPLCPSCQEVSINS